MVILSETCFCKWCGNSLAFLSKWLVSGFQLQFVIPCLLLCCFSKSWWFSGLPLPTPYFWFILLIGTFLFLNWSNPIFISLFNHSVIGINKISFFPFFSFAVVLLTNLDSTFTLTNVLKLFVGPLLLFFLYSISPGDIRLLGDKLFATNCWFCIYIH